VLNQTLNPLEAWMGTLPDGWEKKRLKYLFYIKKDIAGEEGHTVLSVTQQGITPKKMDAKGQFASDYSKYQLVNPGDFVMNHMDLLTGWVDISKYAGVTSPDYRVFCVDEKAKICPDFYKFVFQLCYKHRIFYNLGQGVSGFGRWRLPANMFLNFMIPIPKEEEQVLIANFLKNKIEKIDSLIEQAKASIDEYSKWKESMIQEAVTKGINNKEQLIKSEYPWIGEIPRSWSIPSVRNYFNVGRGRVIAKTEISLEPGEGLYPIYSSQTKNHGCMGYIDTYDFENESLTWTTDGANAGTVFYRKGKFNCTNVCGILTLKEKGVLYMPFAHYSVGLSAYNCRRADINGYKIMSNEMAAIKFVLPATVDEQKQIANYLDEKCEGIENVINEKLALIEDLEKYKTSIIYEYVTGKRRVV